MNQRGAGYYIFAGITVVAACTFAVAGLVMLAVVATHLDNSITVTAAATTATACFALALFIVVGLALLNILRHLEIAADQRQQLLSHAAAQSEALRQQRARTPSAP